MWTDNVFGTSEDEVDDASVRALTWMQVEDPNGNLSWSLRYAPSYEYYFQQNELDGFDHDATGTLSWRMSPRTTLSLSDTFQRDRSIVRFNEEAEPGGDLLLQGRREPVKSNQFSAVLLHSLTPLDSLSFSASYGLIDYSEETTTDSRFLSSGLLYQHRLSPRTTIGARLSWSRQTSEPGEVDTPGDNPDPPDTPNLEDRDTDFYNLSAVLTHDFSRTLRLSLSAGPALVQTDQVDVDDTATTALVRAFPVRGEEDGFHFVDADTCPTNKRGERVASPSCQSIQPALTNPQLNLLFSPLNNGNTATVPILGGIPSADDSNATYFADVTLTKDWERWTGSLSYRRSEDPSSNFGAVSDIVFGRLRWQLSPHFSSSLLASYEIRTQATQSRAIAGIVSNQQTPVLAFPSGAQTSGVRVVELDNDLGADVYSASWQLSYQFAERAEVYSIVRYRDEKPSTDEAAFLVQDVSRFSVVVGVRYDFDPIPF